MGDEIENAENTKGTEIRKDHKRQEILLRWVLGIFTLYIVATFAWAFETTNRVAKLETHTNAPLTIRVHDLEVIADEIRPAIAEIRTDVKHILRYIKENR